MKKILVFLITFGLLLGVSGFAAAETQGVDASVGELITIAITPSTLSFGPVATNTLDNPATNGPVVFDPTGSTIGVRVAVSSVSSQPFTSGLKFDDVFLSTNPFYDIDCVLAGDICTYSPKSVVPKLDVPKGTSSGSKSGVITYTVTSIPPAPVCGDGSINQISEACDAGVNNGVACVPTYGNSCDYCSATCTTVNVPATETCGDSVVQPGFEVCDKNSQTCTTAEGYPGTETCNAQCSAFDACITQESCGDGTVNGPEQCEIGNTQACTTAEGYAGTETCNAQCTGFDSATCTSTQSCGDGVKNGNEACDGTDLGGLTCATAGNFKGGNLSCDACVLNTTQCTA